MNFTGTDAPYDFRREAHEADAEADRYRRRVGGQWYDANDLPDAADLAED